MIIYYYEMGEDRYCTLCKLSPLLLFAFPKRPKENNSEEKRNSEGEERWGELQGVCSIYLLTSHNAIIFCKIIKFLPILGNRQVEMFLSLVHRDVASVVVRENRVDSIEKQGCPKEQKQITIHCGGADSEKY